MSGTGHVEETRAKELSGPPRALRSATAAILAASLALAADQITKAAAFAHVSQNGNIEVTQFLTITVGMNPGTAFGLATTAHPAVLIAVAAAISTALVVMILRSARPLQRAALGAILGGAFGNIADRAQFGAVRDVIDLHWGSWHWPTFNLADAFIAVGLMVLVVLPERPARPASTDVRRRLRNWRSGAKYEWPRSNC